LLFKEELGIEKYYTEERTVFCRYCGKTDTYLREKVDKEVRATGK
jgi:hypothetical protein